jgi:hypothetical protein
MIIKIHESKIFTEKPNERFSDLYNVKASLWNEMYRRHVLLHYTPKDMADFYRVKTGKCIKVQSVKKWIFRTRVYMRAREATKMGARAVTMEFFGELEEELTKELFKNVDKLQKPPKVLV